MKKKAIIISIKSYKLSKTEEYLLSKEKPWGLILFKRPIYYGSFFYLILFTLKNKIALFASRGSTFGFIFCFNPIFGHKKKYEAKGKAAGRKQSYLIFKRK